MLAALLFWLLISLPESVSPPSVYPPDNCVLLQRDSQVTLRWTLPGNKFRVEVRQGDELVSAGTVQTNSYTIPVRPGASYRWSVLPVQTVKPQAVTRTFRIARDFGYASNGRNGGAGQAGTNGGQIKVRLERDEAGMHLYVSERGAPLHYLFTETRERFVIAARGGDGGKGADGVSHKGRAKALGRPGGAAGWGGNVVVTTLTAPWRDYLVIDLSPGQPGKGGEGGYYRRGDQVIKAPDGATGHSGQPGTIDTRLDE